MTTEPEKSTKTAVAPLINSLLIHLAPVIYSGKPACLINHAGWPMDNHIIGTALQHERIIKSLTYSFPFLSGLDSFQFDDRNLIMFYHPQRLREFLSLRDNRDFMQTLGYRSRYNLSAYFELLRKRFDRSVPHEIGIFLGIPADDVRSFIQYRGKNYLFNQYWKVYHNPVQTRTLFDAYDAAKFKMTCMISQ